MSGKLSRKRSVLSQSPAAKLVKEENNYCTPLKAECSHEGGEKSELVEEAGNDIQHSTPMSSQQIQGYTESEITWAEAVSPLVSRWKTRSNTQNKVDVCAGEESPPMFRPSRFMEFSKHPIRRMREVDDSPKRDSGSPKPLEILEKLVAEFRQEKEATAAEEETPKEPSPDRNGNDVSLNNSEDFLLSQALDDVESKLRSSSPVLSQRSSTPKSRMTPRRAMRLRSMISPVVRETQSDVSKLRNGNHKELGNVPSSEPATLSSVAATTEGKCTESVAKASAKNCPSVEPTVQPCSTNSSRNTRPSAQWGSERRKDSGDFNCSQPVIRSFSFKQPSALVRPNVGLPVCDSVPRPARPPLMPLAVKPPTRPVVAQPVAPTPRTNISAFKATTVNPGKAPVVNNRTPVKSRDSEQPKGNWKRWSSMPDKSPLQKNDGFDDDDDFESLISAIKDDSELQQSFSQPTPVRPASSGAEASMDDDFDLELLQAVEQVEAQHRKATVR